VSSGARVIPEAGMAIASGNLNTSTTTTGTTGGTVQVLGNKVAVLNGTINASGANGGGTILVGGDYQGNGTVPNAQHTYISADSTLRADALRAGNGGTAIIWADGTTKFHGSISARGGAQSGNGGLVEVSGKEALQFRGSVDTSAPKGELGTILLDPRNINIENSSSSAGVDAALADGVIALDDFGSDDITISTATLSNLMGNISLQASQDINLWDGLTFTAGTSAQTVTFTAGRNINLYDNLQTQGRSLILNAAGETYISSLSDGIFSNGGNITINSPLRANASTANVNAGTGQVQLNRAVTYADNLNLIGSNLRVGDISTLNNLTFNGATTLTGGTIYSRSGTITLNGPVSLTGDTTIRNQFLYSGAITINGNIDGNHALVLDAERKGLTINGNIGSSIPLASLTAESVFSPTRIGGTITTNSGDIQIGHFSGSISLTNDTTITSTGGNIVLGAPINSEGTPRSLSLAAGAGNATVQYEMGATNPLSQVTISGNDVQTRNISTAGGDIRLIAANKVQLQDDTASGEELILNAGGNLFIQGNQAVTIQATNNPLSRLQAEGDITLVSDGLITANARFLAGGNLSFLTLANAPGNVRNDTQTLISSAGDVTFGNYEGLSLKVESLGSITGGNITITGPNATLSGTDPDIPLLVNSPALVLQAGLPSLQNLPNTPQTPGGTSFTAGGSVTTPATISVGNIKVAQDQSPGDVRIDGVLLSAPGTIQTGNIVTSGKSVTLSSSGGNIRAGDIDTNGFGDGSSVSLTATAGNIQISTIDTGSGGIDIRTAGTFQAIGSFINGFGSGDGLKNDPGLIAYLESLGFARADLLAATVRIPSTQARVSLIARPSTVSPSGYKAPITIRIGDASVPIIDQTYPIESGGVGRVLVLGDSHQAFRLGPVFNNNTVYVPLNASDQVADYNPKTNNFAFKLNGSRALNYGTTEFPADASGAVGGIAIGEGTNSSLYGTFQSRAFTPADLPKPQNPPDPGVLPTQADLPKPQNPPDPGVPPTQAALPKPQNPPDPGVPPTQPEPPSSPQTPVGQEVEQAANRGQLATCTPNSVVKVAEANQRDRSNTNPQDPCVSPTDDAQILKILGELVAPSPQSLAPKGFSAPETINPVEYQKR